MVLFVKEKTFDFIIMEFDFFSLSLTLDRAFVFQFAIIIINFHILLVYDSIGVLYNFVCAYWKKTYVGFQAMPSIQIFYIKVFGKY